MVKIFSNLLLSLILSLVLIIAAEFGLWLVWKISKSTKLSTISNSQISQRDFKEKFQFNLYVDNPQDYLKIAIFGGSSAAGATAEISLANVIDYELRKIIGPNIFVKNFALPGNSFHKEQAEILKSMINHYDIFIIHAGHNEWVNLYYENCGVHIFKIKFVNCEQRKQMRKSQLSTTNNEIYKKFNFFKFLERKSRIYSISLKLKYKLLGAYKNYIKDDNTVSAFASSGLERPAQSESKKAFSKNQINQTSKKYEDDLLEIARLAKKKDKVVIVIGPVANIFWPPYFSKYSEELSKLSVKFLDNNLNKASKNLKNKNFSSARNQIEEALKISPNHSYANYLMGTFFKDQRNWNKSWDFFSKSVDEDGFPHRASSKINVLSKKVVKNFKNNLAYVDYPAIIKTLISNGYEHRKLFSDWVHPTALGHIIIGRSAVCEISKFKSFKMNNANNFCKVLSVEDLEPMLDSYKTNLNISLSDTINSKRVIYRWAVLLSRISAHPKKFYKIAEEHLGYIYPNLNNNQNHKLSFLVLSAFFQAKQGKKCNNLKLLIEQALSISPNKFYDLLEKPFPFPENQLNIKQSFKEAGLNLNGLNSSKVTCSI